MLGKRGYELVSRHAPLAGCLIPVEAKASDLPDIRPCGDGPVAEKGIQVAEQMRAVGWQQPRGCAVATPFVGPNQIMGRRSIRSEERSVGKECVSTSRSRRWTYPSKETVSQCTNSTVMGARERTEYVDVT